MSALLLPSGSLFSMEEFVSILSNLSEKKSSIEAATNYALGKPEHAPELFAAIVDRLQVCSKCFCH